ncbi:hypothetical protein [Sphingomonas aquatilis]|uniref:Uncharacterized protein n=1 Tax=Sphingomonas aquatilis TaxID=93063 RepID=A0AAW3TRV2_9SPHN|nr:hypothetical protein [Sphingomonas aquatilis]MBB3875349.1 hypothetical protein [Sphingomonas aquatilis]MCI4653624.1 hypothetical protein [Sphingomonas aquatilis]GEM71039.1 hypothetical protein SAQ01S_08050 [Sphingomonas aquatilis NBRC 16722]GKS02846.1 hypothetical protein Aug2020_05760 [Sphingomonas aquatilis]
MADEAQDPTPGGHGPGDTEAWTGTRADDGPEGKLYPVAVALRATFDADNHATLSRDVTGLMLDLSRVPFEPHEFEPLLRPLAPPPPAGWLARARLALRRLREARG